MTTGSGKRSLSLLLVLFILVVTWSPRPMQLSISIVAAAAAAAVASFFGSVLSHAVVLSTLLVGFEGALQIYPKKCRFAWMYLSEVIQNKLQ